MSKLEERKALPRRSLYRSADKMVLAQPNRALPSHSLPIRVPTMIPAKSKRKAKKAKRKP